MRIVVVGGGLGGMAAAARLAKLGHQVTLLERGPALGGALGTISSDGFTWQRGPTYTPLPAVLRDLFRKSGRPLERELDLEPLQVLREHRFADGSRVTLRPGRAAQYEDLEGLRPGLGRAWAAYVDPLAETWETLRRDYLERPFDARHASRETRAALRSRRSLDRAARKSLADARLRELATQHAVIQGHDPRSVPAWAGVSAYLEQNFGTWRPADRMSAVGDALARRLDTRGVQVLLRSDALDLVHRQGRVTAVSTAAGDHDADAVVVAIDPRRLPALAPHVQRTVPAPLPYVTHLGLAGQLPEVAHEVVLHGERPRVLRTGGSAPAGQSAWTVLSPGTPGDSGTRGNSRTPGEDVLLTLARHGLDVRDAVVRRLDVSPRDQLETFGGSPWGVRWQGRGTVTARLGPHTPIAGVYAAGAHATPGAGVAYVGLSAALVAQVIGPA